MCVCAHLWKRAKLNVHVFVTNRAAWGVLYQLGSMLTIMLPSNAATQLGVRFSYVISLHLYVHRTDIKDKKKN